MMRLFIAVDLPREVKDELLAAQKLLPQAKLSFAGNFHLTLKFLGEVSPGKSDSVRNCLRNVRFKPFSASLSRIGVFPDENYMRAIWIGLEPETQLIELQKLVDDALDKEFPKEKGFKPHLTLARVKSIDDKKCFIEKLKLVKVKAVSFPVSSFSLKRSTLSPKGAIYDDVELYPK
jgi:RNA 2',3'-cyclic 3'-phosphodiesterase